MDQACMRGVRRGGGASQRAVGVTQSTCSRPCAKSCACLGRRDLKRWNRISQATIPQAEGSRGGFIILQGTWKIRQTIKSIGGVVTAALHGCQPTPLLTPVFHHSIREPSDSNQIP